MPIKRRTYLVPIALSVVATLLIVGCSDTSPDVTPTLTPNTGEEAGAQVEESLATDAALDVPAESQRGDDSQAGPPADANSPGSSPTATSTLAPEPEETPVSETESVGFYIRGFNSIGRGEYIEAERTFTTVIELEPGFARGWDGRGQSLMLQGKLEEAMLDFDRAIELKPNLAEAYTNRALTRVALDDIDGASRDARRAIELKEDSVGAQLVLGRIYARNGDAVKALEWFDLAIATNSEDGATWWWRGRFYRDVLGEGNLALDDFNEAIELAPTQAALYIDRALLYMQANSPTELARADLEEALSLAQDPRLPTIIERVENLVEILDERDSRVQ